MVLHRADYTDEEWNWIWCLQPERRMTALYRFFDETDALLYVGITANVPARISQHSKKHWSWLACRVTLQWWPTVESARIAELEAIKTEDPKYNIRDKPAHLDKPKTPSEPKPRYERTSVVDGLRIAITRGDVPSGDPLVDADEIGRLFGAPRETVEAAIAVLEVEGLLVADSDGTLRARHPTLVPWVNTHPLWNLEGNTETKPGPGPFWQKPDPLK